VLRQAKPSTHVPAEAGVSGGKDNLAAALGCADHGTQSIGDQNSAQNSTQNSAQIFRTFPQFSEGGREGLEDNPQVNHELREKEGALVPPENTGETPATPENTGEMPVPLTGETLTTQQDAGKMPATRAGETPATQQDAGKMPATRAGETPVIQQDTGETPVPLAGETPVTQQDTLKMPVPLASETLATQQDAGKMPATQQDTGKMPVTLADSPGHKQVPAPGHLSYDYDLAAGSGAKLPAGAAI
jgi:hypothetical protein